jgi:hypothetical protein
MRIEAKMDSRPETWKHINRVQHFVNKVAIELIKRGHRHDQSKLVSPEVECFDALTERLHGLTYGSDEYKANLKDPALKPAIDHHQAKNDHHPEFFRNSYRDMNLIQVIEMLCDWKAATERHDDGNIRKSIDIQQTKLGFSDDFKQLLVNTIPFLESEQ